MKLLTIDAENGQPGVVVGDGQVLNLSTAPESVLEGKWRPSSVRILERDSDGLDAVRRIIGAAESNLEECASSLFDLSEIEYLAPIPNPWLIFGWDELQAASFRNEQYAGTRNPAGFIKTRDSLLGSGKAIPIPPQCPNQIDYEGELCFVIGRECHAVSEKEAMEYVAGYTIANDVSARDWIPDIKNGEPPFGPIHGWERNILGKIYQGLPPAARF